MGFGGLGGNLGCDADYWWGVIGVGKGRSCFMWRRRLGRGRVRGGGKHQRTVLVLGTRVLRRQVVLSHRGPCSRNMGATSGASKAEDAAKKWSSPANLAKQTLTRPMRNQFLHRRPPTRHRYHALSVCLEPSPREHGGVLQPSL
jgi:hypothetical protein